MEPKQSARIIITVLDSEGRREGLLRSCSGHADSVQEGFYNDEGHIVLQCSDVPTATLQPSLVVFRHFGDIGIQPCLRAELTVLYGNNGPKDDRFDKPSSDIKQQQVADITTSSRRIERIQRLVDYEGNVTADEVKQIVQFAQRLAGQTEHGPCPKCLDSSPVGTDGTGLLSAIAILCQGYLAVHVDPVSGDLEDVPEQDAQIVSDALIQMKWRNFLAEGANDVLSREMIEKDGRRALRKEVCDIAWWRILNHEDEGIETAIAGEWVDGPAEGLKRMEPLIRSIGQKGDSNDAVSPREVAAAFLAICEHPLFQLQRTGEERIDATRRTDT